MTSNLIILVFLVSIQFIPAPVFTATFTTIRVPLSIAPIVGIPRPDFKDAEVSRPENVELYAKATIYDDLTLSTNYDLSRILASTITSVISNVFVIEERGLLHVDKLFAYNCTTWCLDLQISEITRVTGKTMENLKGNPDSITMLEFHNLIVQTLEDHYCFNMTVIEQRLNMSSEILLENEWALFVPEIVEEAVQCKANTLGVTVSELAELLRTTLATLYGYTLVDLTNIFSPNFILLQVRKNLFETRSLDSAYGVAGLTQAQGEAETMLFFAGSSSIAFSLRDLEILYDWQKPQLYAIENIPLSSYLSQCSVITSNSLIAVSTVLFGQGTTKPTCNVAYVLSRSLNEVETNFNSLTTVETRNSLYVFMTATSISSWFVMYDILQLDIDEGIWVEIPPVSHVATAASQNTTFIKTCSLPQVIVSLKSSNVTGTLEPLLENNYPTFRNLLLTTYGYGYNELANLTQAPLSQLSNLSVVELHAIILEALADRYFIPNLPVLLGVPGVVNMHILSTLPSFEWSRIVIAAIRASFAHAADALSVNIAAGSHIAVMDQADGNPSIQIIPSPIYFSPKVTTSALATCLLGRKEAEIYTTSLTEYHTLFSNNIIPIVQGKITIESTPLENLLATDNLVLQQVWNKTVAVVVAQYTGLTVQQLGCLYGWNQDFLYFINTTTWGAVSAFRLCSEYEKLPIHQILVQLLTAPAGNCHVADVDECAQQSPCHFDATCQNTIDSYTCTCKTGYVGTGMICADFDECSSPTACHSDANCRNTVGSYTCSCKPGFSGNGKTACTALNPNPPSSSNSNTGVIIGVVVAATVVIVTVILIVACFFYRRKPRGNKKEDISNVQNAAYEGDAQPNTRKLPQVPPVAYSVGGYEEPSDYAQLDSSKRVPIDGNYQTLIPKGNRQNNSTDAGDYSVLERGDEYDERYTSLENKSGVNIGEGYVTVMSGNETTNESIYEELP